MKKRITYLVLFLLSFSVAFAVVIDIVRISDVPLILDINVYNDGEPPVEITDFHFSVSPPCEVVAAEGPPGWTLRYALPNSFVEMDAGDGAEIPPGGSGSFRVTLEGPCEDASYTLYLTSPEGVIPGSEQEGPLGPLDVGTGVRPENIEIEISPNPFNSSCAISVPARARIVIYDLTGQIIDKFDCGCSRTTWTWRPDENRPSGIYLVKATLGDLTLTKRLVYMK